MIGHMYWGGMGGWLVLAGSVSLAFIALVVVLVASLVRNRPGPGPIASSIAIRGLEERCARGEISRDEFLERRAVLTGAPTRPPGGTEQSSQRPDAGGSPPGPFEA
jgi:uncharacterized membrane protein